MVARTLSKSYALAGLRFGYLVAQPQVIRELVKVKDSYNCDALSIAGATAAIDDQAWLAETRATILATRARMTGGAAGTWLQRRRFAGQLRVVHARRHAGRAGVSRVEASRRAGAVHEVPGWGDGLRITVGTDEQVDACLALLAHFGLTPAALARTSATLPVDWSLKRPVRSASAIGSAIVLHSAYSAQGNRITWRVVVRHARDNRFNPYGPYNRSARQVRHRRTCRFGPRGAAPVGVARRGQIWGEPACTRQQTTNESDRRRRARGGRVRYDGRRTDDNRPAASPNSATRRLAGTGNQCAVGSGWAIRRPRRPRAARTHFAWHCSHRRRFRRKTSRCHRLADLPDLRDTGRRSDGLTDAAAAGWQFAGGRVDAAGG